MRLGNAEPRETRGPRNLREFLRFAGPLSSVSVERSLSRYFGLNHATMTTSSYAVILLRCSAGRLWIPISFQSKEIYAGLKVHRLKK